MKIILSAIFNGDGSHEHLLKMQDARAFHLGSARRAIAQRNWAYAHMCRIQARYWTEQIHLHNAGVQPGSFVERCAP